MKSGPQIAQETLAEIYSGGREFRLSAHLQENRILRDIPDHWIIEVLNNPIYVEDDVEHNSTNYYGFIEGQRPLLMVAVSKSDDRTIATAHFHSGASRRYARGEL